MPFDEFRWFGVTYEAARTGCYNGAARLEDMDIDGVHAELLYPPQRTMSHFLGDDDDDFVLAGVEAYNNFLFEEFCAPDPKRLIGMAQIPSLGIDTSIDALRKAKARGAKGVRDLQLAVRWRRASRPRTIRSGLQRWTRACRSRCTSTSSAAGSARRVAGRRRRAGTRATT